MAKQKENHLKTLLLRLKDFDVLFKSIEGKILLTGIAFGFFYIFWLSFCFVWAPKFAQIIAAMTATHLMFGRAAGMSFGYAVDLGHWIIVPVNMLIESVLVLVFYPLFYFSWNQLLNLKFLKRLMRKMHHAAKIHKEAIRRYGVPGIFIFVCFPFWMTGPLVGSIIAYFLGFPVWLNLSVVLAGTYMAIIGWAFVLRGLNESIAQYSPYAPIILLVILIFLGIFGHFVGNVNEKNK